MQYGPALHIMLLTLLGGFMALTGIILHTIEDDLRGEGRVQGIREDKRHERSNSAGNPARDN